MVEDCYIKYFNDELLSKYGLTIEDKELIIKLVKEAIDNKLYTNTKDAQHNLKHIEKVLIYTLMIIKRMDNPLIKKEILLRAALYHDIGKSIPEATNKNHGRIGAAEFKRKMKGVLTDKEIEIISILIYQHAEEENEIDFTNSPFTEEEKVSIQMMSDILKDADALDRNRLNYPAPIGTCDINRLRTESAKEILPLTNSFYFDYYTTIIKKKEESTNKKIINNFDLLDEWIEDFNDGKTNMYHASLDPTIDTLLPAESTQKGSYVYAGRDPVNCITMAAFRSSMLFPRANFIDRMGIIEVFNGSIEETLKDKYITVYKLPNESFHRYEGEVTAAKRGEWVSEKPVKPIEQVSVPALDMLRHLVKKEELKIVEDNSEERILTSFINSLDMYIWGLKSIKTNPEVMENKWAIAYAAMSYYSPSPKYLKLMRNIKKDLDETIEKYIEDYKIEYGKEPDFDNEGEVLSPLLDIFHKKYFRVTSEGKRGRLNMEVIKSMLQEIKEESKKK